MNYFRAVACMVLVLSGEGAFAKHRGGGSGDFCAQPTIRAVVPFAAGSTVDTIARLVTAQWAELASKAVVVENHPGGNGLVGTELVVRAPNSCTLLFSPPGPITVTPVIAARLPYDPLKDLAAVARIGEGSLVLVANPSVAAKDMQDLIRLIKERKSINFASSGTGSLSHLAGELLGRAAGGGMTHVPYKGVGPAMTDLVAGQVQVAWMDPIAAVNSIRAARLRALAVSGSKRLTMLPEVPTAQEAGVSGLEVTSWIGIFAPTTAQKADIEDLLGVIEASLRRPLVQEAMGKQGIEPAMLGPGPFMQSLRAEQQKWSKLTRELNLKE